MKFFLILMLTICAAKNCTENNCLMENALSFFFVLELISKYDSDLGSSLSQMKSQYTQGFHDLLQSLEKVRKIFRKQIPAQSLSKDKWKLLFKFFLFKKEEIFEMLSVNMVFLKKFNKCSKGKNENFRK